MPAVAKNASGYVALREAESFSAGHCGARYLPEHPRDRERRGGTRNLDLVDAEERFTLGRVRLLRDLPLQGGRLRPVLEVMFAQPGRLNCGARAE